MNDTGGCSQVNQPVQLCPALPTEAFDHFIRGSNGQREHQEEPRHADKDKRASRDVLSDAQEVKKSIKPNICQQVQGPVEKGKQSDHPTNFHKRVKTKGLSQRSNRNCGRQKDQSHHPGSANGKLLRICAYFVVIQIPEQKNQGNQRIYEDDGFCEANVVHGVRSRYPCVWAHFFESQGDTQKFLTKSIPS